VTISTREIKYEKTTQDIYNDYYQRVLSEAQSSSLHHEIPQPLLKIALDRFGKGNKEKQQNIIQAIWILLFGEGTTTTAPTITTTTKANTTTTTTTTVSPGGGSGGGGSGGSGNNTIDAELEASAKFNQSLIMRTRRTTKYKIEGNCKNAPKKHKDTEYDEDV
jgi:hypothetical protein